MATVPQDFWKPMMMETLRSKQDILNTDLNLFEQDTQNLGAVGSSFQWLNLESIGGAMENIEEGTAVSPSALDQEKTTGIVIGRGAGYKETEVRKIYTGDGQLDAQIAMNMAIDIRRTMATDLKATLDGGFGAATATPLVNDISSDALSDCILDQDILLDIVAEEWPNAAPGHAKYLIVHPDVYNSLRKQITTGYDIQDQIIQNFRLPSLGGINLIYSTQLCDKDTGVYTSYLVTEKAFNMNITRPMTLYRDFDPSTGAGTNNVYYYAWYAIAPKNLSWTGTLTASPTKAELEDTASWAWKYHDVEQVPIRQIKSKIVANEA